MRGQLRLLMAFTGSSTGTLTKAQMVSFVRDYLYKEAEVLSTKRARRAADRDRERRIRMVHAFYKLFFVSTAVTGSGDVFDQQTEEDQFAVLSWFAQEIGLQIRDQTYSGTTAS